MKWPGLSLDLAGEARGVIGRKPGRELLRGEVGSILRQGEVVFTFVP